MRCRNSITKVVNEQVVTAMLVAWVDAHKMNGIETVNQNIQSFIDYYQLNHDISTLYSRYYRAKNEK